VTAPPEDQNRGRSDERNAELRQLFFESAQDLLQALNEQAMLLEKSPGQEEPLRGLRRTVHTLKGDAAACGYRELSELAHELEDVLMLESSAAASVPDIALRAADVFAAMLDAYCHDKKLPNAHPLRKAIAELASRSAVDDRGPQQPAKPQRSGRLWTEYERLAICKALQEGKRVYRISVQLDAQCGMPIAARQMIRSALATMGEILALPPTSGGPEPMLEFGVASDQSGKQLRERCRIPTVVQKVRVVSLRRKSPQPATFVPALAAAPPEAKSSSQDTPPMESTAPVASLESTGAAPLTHSGGDQEASPAAFAAGPDNILRVDAEKIDSVLNLVGELILAKSMLHQTYGEFADRYPKDGLRGKFSDALAFQARVLNDLQRSVMKSTWS
jgi:two-component system chemotaxis sensor kinase CheA